MNTSNQQRETIVVIGNGMVGLRFCEKLIEFDRNKQYRIVTFCEEPRAAYDRVGLTSFFAHRDAEKLMLARMEWYEEQGIELHLGDRASMIDRKNLQVTSSKGVKIRYDKVVIATGSYPFVPPVPGIDKKGVFVYRTIEDLKRIIEYGANSKTAAVLGGGLLGLEAAKAVMDLGLETHVIERNPQLMPQQIDQDGSDILVSEIEALGTTVHLNANTEAILGNGKVTGIQFSEDNILDIDLIVVSTGIRPRDELARESGLEVGERGGVLVNDHLQTSDPEIFCIGEAALHGGMIYGLVAPGYEMAETLAANLTGGDKQFNGTDLSTKLKLMGIEVASFGNYQASPEVSQAIAYNDPIDGIYKKLVFSKDGKRLIGGMLVGDSSDYGMLSIMAKGDSDLPCAPHELILGKAGGAPLGDLDTMPDEAQICSCNNVTKGAICQAISDQGLDSVSAVKTCTKAGSGCAGCMPLVTDLFNLEMKKAGVTVTNHLCEHFEFSRTEMFAIIKTKQYKTFNQVIEKHGKGHGCELCKPAIASILASLWNENVLDDSHHTLQDTNDRFLANIQRGGTYSIVPRIPGGEITPEKLIVIGEIGKKYGLYTKITGGQRVDLFGAEAHQLPEIWERLVEEGFESGHAYGKALRTVKSCVGSTWCRYGVQNSVGFAIRIENRYKGIRSPHKLKSAVSGCTRECAEARSKDFGLIATENGYNLYVCGNGGTKPRHADLLVGDLDEETAIKYIDRFLMYYITTADKLMRTSAWLDKLEGGIEHLREVVIEDKLGICDELDQRMQHLVDTYQCEWAAVVKDPEKRKFFRQFMNTEQTEPTIEFVSERSQSRPADWQNEFVDLENFRMLDGRSFAEHEQEKDQLEWIQVGMESDFPIDGGSTIKYGKVQIAVFNFASKKEWYATQNMCPHKKAFVLSRAIIGDQQGTPKISCPLHKKNFSLETGESLQGEEYKIQTFEVKIEAGKVFLNLPSTNILDQQLATEIGCKLATHCSDHVAASAEKHANTKELVSAS
ncbi:MAG: nitrite reductase small subunit NirD [Planctomycetaceae bacterium]|nr:nitrite reductase small subunit NirD [Planctomycetaceae bacterium]